MFGWVLRTFLTTLVGSFMVSFNSFNRRKKGTNELVVKHENKILTKEC